MSEKILIASRQEVLRAFEAAEVGRVGSVSLQYLSREEGPEARLWGWLDGNANLGSPPGVEVPEKQPAGGQRTQGL